MLNKFRYKYPKRALILLSALSLCGCGIISLINKYSVSSNPKALVKKSKTNVIVALTSDNTLYTSDSGESWTQVKIPQNLKWNNIVSVNGKLFLLGVNGGISASSDALTWKDLPVSDYRLWLMDLAYPHKAKVYAAVGINGLTLISSGLSNWTINQTSQSTWFTSIAYGDNKLVATGSLGEIYYTLDEKKWTQVTSNVHYWLSNIKYINGKFYIVGDNGTILSSNDAIKWDIEKSNTINWLYSITSLESDIFVVGANSTVLRLSPTSSKWQMLNTNLNSNTTVRTIDRVGKTLFIGGDNGLIGYSADGIKWNTVNLNTSATIIKITHLENLSKKFTDDDAN